jgi:hypothetical protein
VIRVFAPAAQIASDLLGIPVTLTAGPGGVPFFMEPEQVRSLFDFVQDRTQQSLPDWFQQKGMITEFVLYSAWIQHQTGDLATRYSDQKYWPCNLCHSEVARLEQKFSDMHKPTTLTVSIHRNAWGQLSADQQQQYRDFLHSRGIR